MFETGAPGDDAQVVGADVVLEGPQVTVEPFPVPRAARIATRKAA